MLNAVRRMKRAPAMLVAALVASLAIAAVAVADSIVGDADTGIHATQASVTKAPGSTGTGSFYIEPDDNGTDPVNGCNAGGNNPPVVLNVASDSAWLTLSTSQITLTGCNTGKAEDVGYTVSSSAPLGASAKVTATYASGGKPGGSYTPGHFTVSTSAAPTDTTPPTISSSVLGTSGENGWYVSNVDVSWTVTDPESAFTTSGCEDSTVSSDTSGTTFTCSAQSGGGNNSSSVLIKRDATAPSVPNVTTNPASPGSGDWFADSVTVSYDGSSDTTSGVAGYSAPQTFSTSGTHSYSGTATDNAGNESDPVQGSVKVDADAPTVSIAGCPETMVEQASVVLVETTASDAHSGLAEEGDPSGSSALDTTTIGIHEFVAEATDNAGHGASATCSYEVVAAQITPGGGGETPGGGGETPGGAPDGPNVPGDSAEGGQGSGGGSANQLTPRDSVFPTLTNLVAREKCLRNARLGRDAPGSRDIAFSYDLSEDSTVTLSIQRRNSSRRARTSCPGARTRSKGEGTPDVYSEVGSQQENGRAGGNENSVGAHSSRRRGAKMRRFVGSGKEGRNRFRLSALTDSGTLEPGLYRLVASAEDAAGNRSEQAIVKFWVLR